MARLDDTSDPTAYGQIDSFNPPTPIGSANNQSIDYGGTGYNATPVDYSSPYFGGSVPSPAAEQASPGMWNGGSVPAPTQYAPAMQINNPGYVTGNGGGGGGGGGGGMAGTAYHAPIAPVHHNATFYKDNGQAATDTTYQAQKAALVGKLNDYEGNIARQVGSGNMVHNDASDPNDLLGFSWSGKALDPKGIYNQTQDQNGNLSFSAKDDANGGIGGTLGADYATGVANFDNQQQHGLRNIAEDFAARGMLGSGSGVWQTAKQNAQDQYNQQLTNMTNSTVNQYNNLLAGLGDQFSQGRGALTGYLTDASNRMATADALNLPTSV